MTAHPAIAAVPKDGTPNRTLLQDYLISDLVHFLDATEDPTQFDPTNAAGAIVNVIAYKGKLFWYDFLDSTTAHDGTTTLVALGGFRYKIEGVNALVTRVLDKDLTTPPTSTGSGNAYIVGTAAIADWATHDDEIAIDTARGWEFITPTVGWLVQVADEDTIYRLNEAGSWVLALDPQGSSILASMMNGGRTHWVIENQTTDVPPSAGQGVNYIIGDNPTGAWLGQSGKIAVRETSGTSAVYTIYTPQEGWTAYDKDLNITVIYNDGVWGSASGAFIDFTSIFTVSGSDTEDVGSGYTFSATTAPTTSASALIDDVTLSYAARRAGAKLLIEYHGHVNKRSAEEVVAALFVDSETNAIEWNAFGGNADDVHVGFRALITAVNTNSRAYQMRFIRSSSENTALPSGVDRRLFTITELAS